MHVPIGIVEVEGPSMAPTLNARDRALIHYGGRVRPGDVVVLRHPLQQDLLVVKRAAERRPGGWWVLGDNGFNDSGDSEDYGTVPDELVLGVARLRLRPPEPGQTSLAARAAWLAAAVRPLFADPSASTRLRAR
ncbi:nickel-type superoxide dismutase maturation protease [Streptomyces sp. G-G2]|uniref:nickel-type superoxide dismutase maturation protease n=1 Tax=Streptomyces sp. G-G2 TaxID=3046201 RepID=UPI0024B99B87|nr:nickel-type superoxide dismutase maturation protease [Streptomyces sp. G-G2]MDJ0379284.1 nickel-type superoxide dismutase maturation protease [Streptomyces sp. G-G2]